MHRGTSQMLFRYYCTQRLINAVTVLVEVSSLHSSRQKRKRRQGLATFLYLKRVESENGSVWQQAVDADL